MKAEETYSNRLYYKEYKRIFFRLNENDARWKFQFTGRTE